MNDNCNLKLQISCALWKPSEGHKFIHEHSVKSDGDQSPVAIDTRERRQRDCYWRQVSVRPRKVGRQRIRWGKVRILEEVSLGHVIYLKICTFKSITATETVLKAEITRNVFNNRHRSKFCIVTVSSHQHSWPCVEIFSAIILVLGKFK